MTSPQLNRFDEGRCLLLDIAPESVSDRTVRRFAAARCDDVGLPSPRVPAGNVEHPHRIDAVLDIIGNTTVLDSLAMLRRQGHACLVGFLGGGGPLALEPVFQILSGVHLSVFASALVTGAPAMEPAEWDGSRFHPVAKGMADLSPRRWQILARLTAAECSLGPLHGAIRRPRRAMASARRARPPRQRCFLRLLFFLFLRSSGREVFSLAGGVA